MASKPQTIQTEPLTGMAPPDFICQGVPVGSPPTAADLGPAVYGPVKIPPTAKDLGPRVAGPVAIPPTARDIGPQVDGAFRVHEWGLIPLEEAGSKNPARNLGADLPDFAKRKVEDGGVLIPPTAKPVLYFYKSGCTYFSPDIRISAPGGRICYFWPPGNCPDASTLFWRHNILSLAKDPAKARPVPKGHWFEKARDTDSLWLTVHAPAVKGGQVEETERFLFYDGFVPYTSPLKLDDWKDGPLKITHAGTDPLHDLMLIRNRDGKTRLAHIGSLAPKGTGTLDVRPCEDPTATLTKLLVQAGLYEKEAAGMAAIWKKDLFEREGDWLLWRLDPKTIDTLQPLTIKPKPAEVVRVHLVLMPVKAS